MSTTERPPSKYLEQAKAKAIELKIELPNEPMTDEEYLDFIQCGNLELFELNKEAEKINRERIALREQQSNRIQREVDKQAKRDQLTRDRATLDMEKKQLENPVRLPELEAEPDGLSQLRPDIQALARRIWNFGSGWNATNKLGLVKMFAQMAPDVLAIKAAELRDAMASDAYSSSDLSPAGILRGYAGVVPDNIRLLSGGEDAMKLLGADGDGGRSRKGGKKNKRKSRDADESDDGPGLPATSSGNPWDD